MFVWFFALCNLALLAQSGQGPRIVHTKEKSAIHVPPQAAPAGLKKIFSNLGTKTNLYFDIGGWLISGPNSTNGFYPSIALPFTPKSNSHVSQARAAVQYFFSGANQVNLSIYGDSGGIPGTLLAGPVTVTNLPDSGTCCTLAIASFTPVAVTGGSRYWLVADTPASGKGSDFQGVWDTVATPVIPMAAYSDFENEGWLAFNADKQPAGEVLGTIP
jgi:hypothetical protein